MAEQPTNRDQSLRSVLTELSMGRLTVDEAYALIFCGIGGLIGLLVMIGAVIRKLGSSAGQPERFTV